MAYVHILRCADDTLYVGSTIHLSLRLEQHQAGLGSAYTKRRLPVELIWSEDFSRVDEAFAWEKRIQGWSHAKRMLSSKEGWMPSRAGVPGHARPRDSPAGEGRVSSLRAQRADPPTGR